MFLIAATFLRGYLARTYKPYSEGLKRENVKVSVVIPEYNEDLDIFEKVVKSAVENKPDEIIIVYEDGRKEIEKIAKKYKAKGVNIIVFNPGIRLGKRASLALAWMIAKGDIIVQLDSDTIMQSGAIDEIIKPFSDPKVVGVQGHPLLFRTGGKIPYILGQVIELSRDIVCKMLDGELVVIDGKIAAYRRDFLIKNIKEFLIEKWGKKIIIVADDRALTFLANIQGYKTVYQSTALALSAAQPTLTKFILQQLRWARSGYLYLIKDIKTGLFFKSTRRYRFQMLTYLFAPVSFTVAWVQTFLANVEVVNIVGAYINSIVSLNIPVILFSLFVFIVGLAMTFNFGMKALGIDYNEIKKLSITAFDYVVLGIIGLFVIYPMTLYAMVTYRNVTSWLTR
jgi:cellulose synthase/poly-beta-1,6-N-acetylglucosamine synthase-like glycosyltransferase